MACANHPGVVERRACTSCTARWCEACVRPVGLAGNREICPTCGHLVKAIVSRSEGLPGAVRRAIGTEGLVTAAAFALFHLIANLFAIFDLLYLSALVAFYFAIVHHVGVGKSGLPGPSDATDDWVDVLGFAVRGIACVALGLAPLIVTLGLGHHPSRAAVIALLVVGQLYLPAAVIAITLTNRGLVVLWPVTWVRVIARAPSAYARFLGLWFASVGIGLGLAVVTTAISDGALVGVGASFVWNLFWFAQAGLVGDFIRDNASAFGWD